MSPLRTVELPAGYESLWEPLSAALIHAAYEKGRERHAARPDGSEPPFDRQPMLEIARMTGAAGPLFQVMKKAQEAVRLEAAGDHDRALAELYGAIVYAAGAALIVREASRREDERRIVAAEADLARLEAATAGDGNADFARSEGFVIVDPDRTGDAWSPETLDREAQLDLPGALKALREREGRP